MNITLTCDICGKSFERDKGEYNRSQKLGRKNFCSRACSCAYGNKVKPRGNREPPSVTDEYSPFRFFLRKARSRTKTKTKHGLWNGMDLTKEYLKDLWDKQEGKCVLTGWDMLLPKNSQEWEKKRLDEQQVIRRASLDKIDSNEGYIQSNVRFVCYIANICKNSYSDDSVKEFCAAVAKFGAVGD